MKLEAKRKTIPPPVLSKYPEIVSKKFSNGQELFLQHIGKYGIEINPMVLTFIWGS